MYGLKLFLKRILTGGGVELQISFSLNKIHMKRAKLWSSTRFIINKEASFENMVTEPNPLFEVLMNNSLFGTPVSFSKTAALTKFYQIIIDLKAT